MNDGTQVDCSRDGSGTVPARASFERLLRKLQALPNRPAVVVLNAYSFIRGAMGSYLKVGRSAARQDIDAAGAWQRAGLQGWARALTWWPTCAHACCCRPRALPGAHHLPTRRPPCACPPGARCRLPTAAAAAATCRSLLLPLLRRTRRTRWPSSRPTMACPRCLCGPPCFTRCCATRRATRCASRVCRGSAQGHAVGGCRGRAARLLGPARLFRFAGASDEASKCVPCFGEVACITTQALSLCSNLPAPARCAAQVDRVRTEVLEESQPDELFLFDISHPYGPTGHRQARWLAPVWARTRWRLLWQLPCAAARAAVPSKHRAAGATLRVGALADAACTPCTPAGSWPSCSSA